MDVLRYLQIDPRIATSGQPRAEQFADIAAQGYASIVNLAPPDSSNAIADEGAAVARTGMNYINIPVAWDAPRVAQFHTFAALMQQLADQKLWVHCALNMRVSCFMYLWHTERRGMPEPDARALMERIWNPDGYPAWKQFILDVRQQGMHGVGDRL